MNSLRIILDILYFFWYIQTFKGKETKSLNQSHKVKFNDEGRFSILNSHLNLTSFTLVFELVNSDNI